MSSADRTTLINYLGTSSNWSEYAISGKTVARGAMTLPEFIDGYNRVNDEELTAEYLSVGETSSDGSYTTTVDGYVIKKGNESYNYFISGITEKISSGMQFYIIDSSKAWYMWLASEGMSYDYCVMSVHCDGNVHRSSHGHGYGAICPVVSLTSGILVENEDGKIEIK